MVKEKKTGKMFAMKCVKRKQKKDLNLENEINVLRRSVLPSAVTAETPWSISRCLCSEWVNDNSSALMTTPCHFARIKHDNVVGMEDFYESRTHYYLVMQL